MEHWLTGINASISVGSDLTTRIEGWSETEIISTLSVLFFLVAATGGEIVCTSVELKKKKNDGFQHWPLWNQSYITGASLRKKTVQVKIDVFFSSVFWTLGGQTSDFYVTAADGRRRQNLTGSHFHDDEQQSENNLLDKGSAHTCCWTLKSQALKIYAALKNDRWACVSVSVFWSCAGTEAFTELCRTVGSNMSCFLEALSPITWLWTVQITKVPYIEQFVFIQV